MAFSLKGKTMAQATQMLDNALDKSDTGKQIINGIIKIENHDGTPVEIQDENQVITKNDWRNLDSKRYIILQSGDASKGSYLPFSDTIYDNYNINDLYTYPTRIYIPDGVEKIRFHINYTVNTTKISAELLLVKDSDNTTKEQILYYGGEGGSPIGNNTYITQIIDVKNTTYVQIYVSMLTEGYNYSGHVSFNNITMEVLQ